MTFTFQGDTTNGISALENKGTSFSIFPNPATEQAYLRFDLLHPQPVAIAVCDLLGRKIMSESYGELEGQHTERLGISGLHAGVYFVELKTDEGIKTKKLFVQ